MFETLGCQVDDAEPDLSDADEIFRVWRAWYYELAFGKLLDSHRDVLKDTVVWNIEEGRRLNAQQIDRATAAWTKLAQRVEEFFATFAFLVLPVSQVPPFDVNTPYVTEINGEKIIALRMIQGRDPDWVQRPFFAKYNEDATWLNHLEPAFGEERFFFDD